MYFKNHRNIIGLPSAPCKDLTRDLSNGICQAHQTLGRSFLYRYREQYLSNTLSDKPNYDHDYHMLWPQMKPPIFNTMSSVNFALELPPNYHLWIHFTRYYTPAIRVPWLVLIRSIFINHTQSLTSKCTFCTYIHFNYIKYIRVSAFPY